MVLYNTEPPKEILSDQGKEFINKMVAALLEKTGVERRVTSPYDSRTNGLTERFNRTLVEALRIQAGKTHVNGQGG